MNSTGKTETDMIFPNPGAKSIASSMSIVHQHAGSPYINASRPEYQLPNFPIGMVFIFGIVGLIGISAILCTFLKLHDVHRERRKRKSGNNHAVKMHSMSLKDNPNELLNQTGIDYLSVAAMPLLSLYAFVKRMKRLAHDHTSHSQSHDYGLVPPQDANGINTIGAGTMSASSSSPGISPMDSLQSNVWREGIQHIQTVARIENEVDLGKGYLDTGGSEENFEEAIPEISYIDLRNSASCEGIGVSQSNHTLLTEVGAYESTV